MSKEEQEKPIDKYTIQLSLSDLLKLRHPSQAVAIQEAQNFLDGLRELESIPGKTASELSEMSDQIKRMAKGLISDI